MVRTIMDVDYEKCPFCESNHFKKKEKQYMSFGEFIAGTSVGSEAVMRFCPICGRQFYSLEEWKAFQKALFSEAKQENEDIIWSSEITKDTIEEIKNKQLSQQEKIKLSDYYKEEK